MNTVKIPKKRGMRTAKRPVKAAPKRAAAVIRRSPSETMRLPTAVVGWILRTVLVVLGTYAFMMFLGDAGGVLIFSGRIQRDQVVVSQGAMFLTALFSALYAGLLFASRWTAVPALLAGAGGLAWIFVNHSARLIPFLENAFRCLFNTVMMHLADCGYTTYAGYVTNEVYAYDPRKLATWAFCVIAAALALLLGAILLRSVRPFWFALVTAGILIPVFMYNITRTNRGVMLVIAFVCGVLALWFYDSRFGTSADRRMARQKKKKERREAKKSARLAKAEHKKALRLAASDAMISAYDAGGSREDAKAAKAEIYRRDKARREAEKKQLLAEKEARKTAEKEALKAARTEKDPAKSKAKKAEIRAAKKEKRIARGTARKNRFFNTSAGGFAGAGAAVVALVALAMPNSLIDENFPIIESLDNKIRVIRMYATAYLMGDDIDLNSLSLYGGVSDLNPRSVTFSPPYFTGEQIFYVENGYNAPIYLRSWIGTGYDMETDTWISADNDEVLAYRAMFGRDFTPDTVGYNFKKYTYPLSVELDSFDMYRGYSNFGFVVSQTNIRRVGGTSRILFVPTFLNTEMGIMEYGSIEPNEYKVSSYFDGVYSSRFFAAPGRSYSAYSFTTVMKNPTLGTTFDIQSEYFLQSLEWAKKVDELEASYEVKEDEEEGITLPAVPLEEAYAALVTEYKAAMKDMGVMWRGDSILEQYIAMTDRERSSYRFAFVLEDAYRDHAYQTYTGSFGSTAIADLAEELLEEKGWSYDEEAALAWQAEQDALAAANAELENPDPVYTRPSGQSGDIADFLVDKDGNAVTRHDLIMMVLNYLRDESFTYTLTPTAPEVREYGSTLESFLFETKEGYCVHFASAAAAILREYGLAVRYDEGYVAAGFRQNNNEDAVANYRTNVYDYNAHAWIEVYYPLMGWVQYETTPTYMEAMYDSEEGYEVTTPRPSGGNMNFGEEETLPDTEIIFEEEVDYTPFIIAGIIAAAVLLVVMTVWLLILRGRKSCARRKDLIVEARDEAAYYSGSRDNRAVARRLNDAILAVFERLGLPPEQGELSSAYAVRIAEEYGELSRHDITEILPLIEKEEFGHGLTYRELRTLAEYLEDMSTAVYTGLSLPRRFWMRCIRCAV